jgi:hypothetical protein
MPPTYQLVIRSGPSAGKVFPLDKNELTAGRDLNNEIVINDSEISRRHARLFLQGSSYVLEDLGSTNGTAVNGQRLFGPYILRPGEVITFGENSTAVFEAVMLGDATVVSAAAQRPAPPSPQPQAPIPAPQPLPVPQPIYAPPPQVQTPVYQQPPQPMYNQPPQVQQAAPYYNQPYQVQPPYPQAAKKGLPTWALVLVIAVAVIVVGIILIDVFKLWCTLLPFLFPGAC